MVTTLVILAIFLALLVFFLVMRYYREMTDKSRYWDDPEHDPWIAGQAKEVPRYPKADWEPLLNDAALEKMSLVPQSQPFVSPSPRSKRRRSPERSGAPSSKRHRLPWCGYWNKDTGCRNEKVGVDMCRGKNGKKYLHSCEVLIGPENNKKKCGSYTHGKHGHV